MNDVTFCKWVNEQINAKMICVRQYDMIVDEPDQPDDGIMYFDCHDNDVLAFRQDINVPRSSACNAGVRVELMDEVSKSDAILKLRKIIEHLELMRDFEDSIAKPKFALWAAIHRELAGQPEILRELSHDMNEICRIVMQEGEDSKTNSWLGIFQQRVRAFTNELDSEVLDFCEWIRAGGYQVAQPD